MNWNTVCCPGCFFTWALPAFGKISKFVINSNLFKAHSCSVSFSKKCRVPFCRKILTENSIQIDIILVLHTQHFVYSKVNSNLQRCHMIWLYLITSKASVLLIFQPCQRCSSLPMLKRLDMLMWQQFQPLQSSCWEHSSVRVKRKRSTAKQKTRQRKVTCVTVLPFATPGDKCTSKDLT